MNYKSIALIAVGLAIIVTMPIHIAPQTAQIIAAVPTDPFTGEPIGSGPDDFADFKEPVMTTPTPTPDPFAAPLPGDFVGPPAPAAANQPNPCPGTPENELCPPTGNKNFEELLKGIHGMLIKIAIPLAVIIFIWIGIQFFLSQGNPEKVGSAKKALWWTIIGLTIILIGEGFVSLIRSILELSKG